jgi:hypothetical protein
MIYLSGRLDVDNLNHYRSQFLQAEEYLKKDVTLYQDTDVLSLYKQLSSIDDLSELSMSDEIDMRLQNVMICDKLYLLQGWELDDMCKFEYTYAKAKGKKIIYSRKY